MFHIRKKEEQLKAVTVVFLLLYLTLLFQLLGPTEVTGKATAANTTSQIIISGYFAIELSPNLTSDGIDFGNLTSLPVTNENASLNYEWFGEDASQDQNWSGYYMNVSNDSNVNVDGCLKANESLKSGANTIGLGNYTFSNHTSNNITHPTIENNTALSTTHVAAISNLVPGDILYYRFWLDVAGSTEPGTYNNQVEFKAVQNGNGCT
ncbi:hypothetical protein ACFLQN_02845 [Candidatus Aenigmatarchaeota archaeon]